MSRESFRGCIIQAGLSGLAVLALYGLVSNMSWENYEENMRLREERNSSDPYRPPDIDSTPSVQTQESNAQQYPDNCSEYPNGVNHRDEVCVNGQCGATFFGRRGPGIETSWEVQWFDDEGRRSELSCEEVSRDAVVPDLAD